MFQYENNSYGLCGVCRGLIFKRHKSFRGGIEGIKDAPHSNWPFDMKWHNMAEPAMNDSNSLSDLRKCKWSKMFSNTMNLFSNQTLGIFCGFGCPESQDNTSLLELLVSL